MAKDSTQTSTVSPDSNTAQFQDIWRRTLAGSLGNLTGNSGLTQYAGQYGGGSNPFDLSGLLAATRADYDRSGVLAGNAADATATMGGAFGGSRAALLKGTALAQNAANENTALAGIRDQNAQRILQLLSLFGGAGSVGGYSNSMQMPANGFGSLLGAGLSIASLPTGGGGTLLGDILK